MIVGAIISFAYVALSGVIALLPDSTGLPTAVHTAAVGLGGYVGLIDAIAPIETVALTTALAFSFEIAFFGFRTLKWVVSHIPFVGGRG